MKSTLLIFLPILLLVGLGNCSILGGEDKEKPIVWEEESLEGLVVYAYSPDGDSFAVIDLVTGEIYQHLDTFQGLQSVASNADGSLIYVSTYRRSDTLYGVGEIYQVNTTTWNSKIIYQQGAHLLENRNGGLFFITKGASQDLSQRMFGEIDMETGQVLEIDSIDVDWGAWYDNRLIEVHPTQPLLYAVDDWPGQLYRYNYITGTTEYLFNQITFNSLDRITLSGIGAKMYIPGGPVLDLEREEIMGFIPVWRLGSAVSRKDNKEVYITDPGGYLREPYSQGKLFVYDPETDAMKNAIEIGSVSDQIYLTPKERYAVVNNWMSKFLVVDLKTRAVIITHEYIENNVQTQSIQGMYLAPKPPSLN